MPTSPFKVAKCSDKEFLRCLKSFLSSDAGQAYQNLTFTLRKAGNFDTKSKEFETREELTFCSEYTRIIGQVTCDIPEWQVIFNRDSDENSLWDIITVNSPNAGTGKQGQDVLTRFSRIASAIGESFKDAAILPNQNEIVVARAELRQNNLVLSDLISLSGSFLRDIQQFQVSQTSELQEFKRKLQSEHDERLGILENERNQWDEDIRLKKKELDELIKEKHLQESIHERRDVYQTVMTKLQNWEKSFSLNAEVKISVVYTALLFTFFLSVFGYLATVDSIPKSSTAASEVSETSEKASPSSNKASESGFFTQDVVRTIRKFGAVIAFVTLLIWFIRWVKHWSDKVSDEQFRLKKFFLDMNRAHWFIEIASQWKRDHNEPIPEHICQAITESLFLEPGQRDGSPNYESLLSLIAGTSLLSISPTGGVRFKQFPPKKESKQIP